jgi:hypothetical protein
MQKIQVKTHINEEGLLQIKMPSKWHNKDVEITAIIQPLLSEDETTSTEDDENIISDNGKIESILDDDLEAMFD